MSELSGARTGAVLLGIGLGGFVDGIVIHQILQWHNMLSSRLPPHTMEAMKTNMLGDGLFHALVWVFTFVGLLMLYGAAYRRVPLPPMRWFMGLLIFGWGLFNLVEGIINHHLLGLHHVRYVGDMVGGEPSTAWGLGFLLVGGVGFIALGWLMSRNEGRESVREARG